MGFIIMTAGVGLFGTFTGYLANIFLAPPREKKEEQEQSISGAETPQAKLSELKRLLDEQKQSQAALEAKINELETLL